MENNLSRYNRSLSNSLKQRRSGYEPSDTETDWQETPRRETNGALPQRSARMDPDSLRKISPLRNSRRHSSRFEGASPERDTVGNPASGRHTSKSPYKSRRDDGGRVSPIPSRRNVSPFSKAEQGRQVSPYKNRKGEQEMYEYDDEVIRSNRRRSERTPTREERSGHSQFGEVSSRASERSNHSRRSATAPRTRPREREQENGNDHRDPSPLGRNKFGEQGEMEATHRNAPSVGELNEMVANIKIARTPMFDAATIDASDSIGDIFFSRDNAALAMKKNGLAKNGKVEADFYAKPVVFPGIQPAAPQRSKSSVGKSDQTPQTVLKTPHSRSRTTYQNSTSAVSRQSSGKHSPASSKMSDMSGRSFSLFTANRRKSQADGWFSCMRKGPRKTSSPEGQRQQFDEASFIQRAFVVENLRQFWADKYQPRSLNGFICHKKEAQLLSQLVSHNNLPNILFKGPPGSGKRALTMALLGEIFGDGCWNTSRDLRYFQVQEKRATQVIVPITSSVHHVELNVTSEPNAKYALMGLVKEISNSCAAVPEVSAINFKPDYKVIVLYEVDKASENIQHLIKWIMDCYTDACKLIMCCEEDKVIIDSVKNRCKVIDIDAPGNHEIMEVLVRISRKEGFDLPKSFAAKIASKSKQNLRDAIMALEACKVHNYPFADDQPIPLSWEQALIELAADILSDPTPKRMFIARGKFQKLLVDSVHPRLILLKLVEEFLKGVEASSKRELYYWHAYYEKRLPTGTSALLKLEEFVAKFMSIHRKNTGSSQDI